MDDAQVCLDCSPLAILAQRTYKMIPAPHCVVCAKTLPLCRRVCLLDADDLAAIKATCAKLYKKAGIFYIKFRTWDSCFSSFIGLRSLRLKWFTADSQSNYSDARIKVDGKLVPWSQAVSQ